MSFFGPYGKQIHLLKYQLAQRTEPAFRSLSFVVYALDFT
jgi:hypothetical protein